MSNRNYEKRVYLNNSSVIAEIILPHALDVGSEKYDQHIDSERFNTTRFWQLNMNNEQLKKAFDMANKWIDERFEIIKNESK